MSNAISLKNGYCRVMLFSALLLLVPLVAMEFSDEVNWDKADFIVMAALLISLGCLYVLVVRQLPKHPRLIALIFVTTLLYIWAELAVGIIF